MLSARRLAVLLDKIAELIDARDGVISMQFETRLYFATRSE